MDFYTSEVENVLNKKTAFLLDFDGTIAHTERLQLEAYNIVLQKYGVKIDKEKWMAYIGNPERKIYEMIKEDFNIDFNAEELMKKRFNVYLKLVDEKELKPFPFFIKILNKYKNKKYFILTSNRKDVVEKMLSNWNMLDRFEEIISIEAKNYSKKEILTDTEKYLKLNKLDIVYFEDMDRNLKIAKELNITTIGIENEFNENKLKNCDYIIKCI